MKPLTLGRRSFFWKAGAAVSATLAAALAPAAPSSPPGADDVQAIRDLQRAFGERFDPRRPEAIAALLADRAEVQLDGLVRVGGETAFEVEVAPNRRTATARFGCAAQAESALAFPASIVEMARHQGEGCTRAWRAGVFESAYVREGEIWKISRLVFRMNPQPPPDEGIV
jgi:hypothetical protein